jgi:single-stranded-DNA-specific exonuclease
MPADVSFRLKAVRCRTFFASPSSRSLPLIDRLLKARGADHSSRHYTLKTLQTSDDLKGCNQAAVFLADAMQAGRSITLVGDYDVDGATSTALAVLALRAMGGARVDYFVPDRFEHGYGLSPSVVAALESRKPDILLTVDNGISSLEGVAMAKSLGMSVVITDHHLPGSKLPDADAIVNPNQQGCGFPWKSTAGVGVIFYLLAALRRELKARGWFTPVIRPEPPMSAWLDLVALGTVADVVPLEFNNRVLVAAGLKRIRAGNCRPGIKALLAISGKNLARTSASDLAFFVAPKLNAAGRLQDISVGIECLMTDNPDTALFLAGQLNELNRVRKEIEFDMREQAVKIASSLASKLNNLPAAFCLYDASWHEGVLGIVAARIKDQFHRPVITLAKSESGELKGSGRSIPGLHLRDALDEVATTNPGLLAKFGGHAMAAGLTMPAAHLDRFRECFQAVVASRLTPECLEAILETDGELREDELTLHCALEIADAGPWGQGFPEPLFQGRFLVLSQRLIGEKHLKFRLQDPRSGREVDAIAFNTDTRANFCVKQAVDLVYRLGSNEYRGVITLQLVIEQLAAVPV